MKAITAALVLGLAAAGVSPEQQIKSLEAENDRLKKEVAALKAQIAALTREKVGLEYALKQARKAAATSSREVPPASKEQMRRDYIGGLEDLVKKLGDEPAGHLLYTMFRNAEDGVSTSATGLGYERPFAMFNEKRGRTEVLGVQLFYVRGGDPMQVILAYGGGATRLTLSNGQRGMMAGILRSWITKAKEDARKDKPPASGDGGETKPEAKPKPKPKPEPTEIQPF